MLPIVERPDLAIVAPTIGVAAFGGGGDIDYVCAHCPFVLAKAVAANVGQHFATSAPEGLVIKCPACARLSSFPPDSSHLN
jgi:hypothetical protein